MLILGFLLVIVSPDSTDNLDKCLAQAPVESPPPITWGASEANVESMWSNNPPVSLDSVRASLLQIRRSRECFLRLDPSRISRPYLGNIMRTFDREAALLAGLRRFSEAFETFEEARSYLAGEPSVPSTNAARTWWPRTLHQNQGYLHYLLGDLSASIEHYLKAYEATPEAELSQRAQLLIDIGVVHQRAQDYRSAHHYYDRAQHLFRENGPSLEKHASQRARLLHFQADLLLEETLNTSFDRSALKRVRDLAQRGRSFAEPGTVRHARVSVVLSESLGYLGTFDRAYSLNEEARKYARLNDDIRTHTLALLKLGVLHVQTGHWARAETVLKQSLTMAENLNAFDYQRRILRALGRMHELQSNWGAAASHYRQGVSVIEEYRESLTATQWSTTAFAQWRDVYRGLVRVLLAQGKNRAALATLDRSRARHLQDLRTQARVTNQLPPDQRARFDSLTQALTDVRNQLGQGDLSAQKRTALRSREASLMSDRQQILQIDSMAARPEVAEIQAVLDRQNRVLVSYFLDDPWPVYGRTPRSSAFVLTADTLRTVSLGPLTQDSVQAQLETISPLFTPQSRSSRANAMHFDLRPLYRLQEALYAPVAAHVPEGRPLTVVPNGPLFHIPFSMLVRSMPGGRYAPSEARFVLHERPMTVELASSLVADTARHAPLRPSSAWAELAVFGVSDFDTLRTVPPALRTTLAPLDSLLVLPDLPGVRSELQAIRRRVEKARVFLDEAATEERLWRTSQRAGVLHLASHAFFHPSSPLHNAFLLHPDSSGRDTDGILFLHELQTRERPMRLVVLSGCNTARGSYRGGEGMEGLQYAFRAMGAEATLSSLWPVADDANVELIEAFYRHLGQGLRKDEALRQAKLEYLEAHPDRASPFFWATTVLYGSPASLDLESSRGLPAWAWWGLVAGGVVLVGVLLWWGLRRSARRRL